MLKTFAAALAPIVVLAADKGDGTGVDQANAGEIVLIPGKLSLYTYNKLANAASATPTDEFHGDLSWTVAKPVAPNTVATADTYNQFTEQGFCLRNAATAATTSSLWDCLASRSDVVNANTSDAAKTTTWSQAFTITDKSWTGIGTPAATAFTATATPFVNDTDYETTTDASVSWVSVPANSFKTNCSAVAPATTPATYWCENLNSHFFRNFTITGKNAAQDAVFASPTDKWQIFGWVASYPTKDATTGAYTGAPKVTLGNILTVSGKVVYQTYMDNREAAIKKAKCDADPACAKAAAVTACGQDKTCICNADPKQAVCVATSNTTKKDATSLTTCAAALIATVYALSF